MSIVLPIVFFSVCLGLFAKRITRRVWSAMICCCVLVIAYNYIKGSPVVPMRQSSGDSSSSSDGTAAQPDATVPPDTAGDSDAGSQ